MCPEQRSPGSAKSQVPALITPHLQEQSLSAPWCPHLDTPLCDMLVRPITDTSCLPTALFTDLLPYGGAKCPLMGGPHHSRTLSCPPQAPQGEAAHMSLSWSMVSTTLLSLGSSSLEREQAHSSDCPMAAGVLWQDTFIFHCDCSLVRT